MVEVAELHMFRLGSDAETVVGHLDTVDFISIRLAKSAGSPIARVFVGFFRRPAVDVPGQVHAELQFLFRRLDVAHVDNPLVANALVVCLAQLITAERRRNAAEPKIGVGRTPIGEVVIDGISARTRLLCLIGHLAYVAVIVVHPHQRHIVRNLQSRVVAIEHLLVGNENLRDGGRVADAVGKELTLVGDNLRQRSHPLGGAIISVDTCIVYASHTQRVDSILASALAHALCPVPLYHLLIGAPNPV